MKKIFSFFAAVLFAGSMMAAVEEFTVTINTDDFNSTSYAANNGNHTSTAYNADSTKSITVDWTSNQMMLSSSKIQGQKSNAYLYNAAAWGTIKSVTINGNVNYSYVIGSTAKPTETATGGFFIIKAGSATSKADSFVIVFETDVTAPSISATPSTWNFGAWEQADGDFVEKTIKIQGANLTGEIALNFMGALFSVVPNRITPDASGNIDADVTIKSALGWVTNESYDLHASSLATTPDFEEKTILTASINVVAPVTNCATARTAALAVSGNNVPFGDGSNYTVRGYVTEIATAWSSTNKNISFWIADAKDGGKVIQAYRAACETEPEAPKVGDLVDVTGQLTKYNTTPEFAQGCTFTIVPTATAIDNAEAEVKAIKRFENGVLIIEKNGVKYNAQGAVVR